MLCLQFRFVSSDMSTEEICPLCGRPWCQAGAHSLGLLPLLGVSCPHLLSTAAWEVLTVS